MRVTATTTSAQLTSMHHTLVLWKPLLARCSMAGMVPLAPPQPANAAWLERFHSGERAVLEDCYRSHFQPVLQAVGSVLRGADQETVVQDVFCRMFTEPDFRASFHGGSIKAWLCTVGRNRAIDLLRKRGREDLVEPETVERIGGSVENLWIEKAEARRLIDRFKREALPAKWHAVFDARFMRELSQREAARELGMRRTTLAYQETRIRSKLKGFLLKGERPT